MEIIEKIKTNKSIDNQTEIQKICLDKLQSVSYTHLTLPTTPYV